MCERSRLRLSGRMMASQSQLHLQHDSIFHPNPKYIKVGRPRRRRNELSLVLAMKRRNRQAKQFPVSADPTIVKTALLSNQAEAEETISSVSELSRSWQ